MLRVDILERHGFEASRNGRMKICTNALLVFEFGSLDIVGCDCSARAIGGVHGWLRKWRPGTDLVLLV